MKDTPLQIYIIVDFRIMWKIPNGIQIPFKYLTWKKNQDKKITPQRYYIFKEYTIY